MSVLLWVGQGLLAVMFALSGREKVVRPQDELAGKYPWVGEVSPATVRSIGTLEMLGATGLIVPAAVGVSPVLTPIAGTGLAVMMVAAAGMHLRRKERSGVVVTVVLGTLAALVAWGRFGPYGW